MANRTRIGETYSSDEFIQIHEKDGELFKSYLKGKVFDKTVTQTTETISNVDSLEIFQPRELPSAPTKKSAKCIGCKKNPPCQSYLSDHFCPECFAKCACYLRTPDIVKREKYMGSATYGSNVTIRCTSDDDDATRVSDLDQLIVRFEKDRLFVLISNRSHAIKDWCFYVEEDNNGQRFPIFEIKENIHFHQGVLDGDFNARLEGQPMCEDILKGYDCECTVSDYPYQDSLPELIAPRGVPGVFPMNKFDGKLLKCGKFGVRCAHRKRSGKKAPKDKPVEDKGAQVQEKPTKKSDKNLSVMDILDTDDPKILQAQCRMLQSQKDFQAIQIQNLTREFQKMQVILERLRANLADEEKKNERLQKKIQNAI
jgi:hypothetical protein